jgi:hypothetical protein
MKSKSGCQHRYLPGSAFSKETRMKIRKRQNQENRWRLTISFAVVTYIFSLSLSACKLAENANPKLTGAPNSTSSESKLKKSGRLDACVLLAKAEVEKILGQVITYTNSGRVMEGNETTAATSECSYQTISAQTIELFVRRSPIADNTPEAIQKVRDTMKEITQKEPLEVTNTGDQAFWTASKQLHVFAQGNIYFYVSMMNFKNETDAKMKAIELACQVLVKLSA